MDRLGRLLVKVEERLDVVCPGGHICSNIRFGTIDCTSIKQIITISVERLQVEVEFLQVLLFLRVKMLLMLLPLAMK